MASPATPRARRRCPALGGATTATTACRRGPLVLLLLATLTSLAVGGSCDSGRRRLRQESRLSQADRRGLRSASSAGDGDKDGWAPPFGGNGTTWPDDSLLGAPSNPELTAQLTAQCDKYETP